MFTPTFLPSFNATIDYYNIKIKNVIGTYGANLILSTCVNSANPLFCSLVNRAPNTPGSASSGSLWLGTQGYITDATYNLGELQQEGIDFEIKYRLDAGVVGKFNFNFNGNYDLHFKTTPYVGSGTYDCAGYYGPSCGADGGVSPRIKSVFTGQLLDALCRDSTCGRSGAWSDRSRCRTSARIRCSRVRLIRSRASAIRYRGTTTSTSAPPTR